MSSPDVKMKMELRPIPEVGGCQQRKKIESELWKIAASAAKGTMMEKVAERVQEEARLERSALVAYLEKNLPESPELKEAIDNILLYEIHREFV